MTTKPKESKALREARIANIAKAREAKARKHKQEQHVVEIPLDTIPAPEPKTRAAKGTGNGRRSHPTDMEALAEFTVAVFLALKRQSGR